MKDARTYLDPITQAEANSLLGDEELHAMCKRSGVDLGMIVNNLKLTPTQRLEQLQQWLEVIRELNRAGRAAGMHQ